MLKSEYSLLFFDQKSLERKQELHRKAVKPIALRGEVQKVFLERLDHFTNRETPLLKLAASQSKASSPKARSVKWSRLLGTHKRPQSGVPSRPQSASCKWVKF